MQLLQVLVTAFLVYLAASHSVKKRESNEKRVVCYYTNWSVYRPGTAKFNPQNINPYLCTHLIYAFGGLDRENGLRPYDKYQDIEQGGYAKFTGLKTYNKALKTMLAIGGWNEGSARFSSLVADDDRRAEFVKNVIKFLRQNHFDGLDLDWEYPAFRDGGKPRDRENYAQLVQELREEFDREHSKTGRPRLLLTMAVPAGIEYIDKGYDIPKLNRYLDFMNILSYDYHSAFEPAVNHHSPLYPLEEENEYNFDAQLSIDYTVKHYMKLGADRDKLVLGIPTYGRSYTLYNSDSTDIGAPADGPGEQGDATREKGYLAYYEICGNLNSNDEWVVRHPKRDAMGPYAYRGDQWVGFDDVDIVKQKAQYVNEKGLGGIMFWSIDNDDFRGKCHGRPYPLIEAGKEALLASSTSNNLVSSPAREKTSRPLPSLPRRPSKPLKPKIQRTTTTTTTPTSRSTTKDVSRGLTTPEPPTTPDPGSDFVCKDEGFFPHPRDCKKYFWCLDSGPSNLGIVAHQFTCPSGLYFNKAADSCDFARNVLCKKERVTTPAPKVVTAATAKTTATRLVTTTTTTTTTEPPTPIEEEADEEDYEEHAEEDPQAIKQLISLIKKLGGVAELEKQLENAGSSDITPPPISKSLYDKVLTPRTRYQSPYRNGPSGPQNEGLAQRDDDLPYRRGKPQYVTIHRERPSATTEPASEEDPIEETTSRIKYQTIERNRGSSQRNKNEDFYNSDEYEEGAVQHVTPKYSTIERQRPARVDTEESEVEEKQEEIELETGERPKPKYTSIQRFRPTTEEGNTEATTSRYVILRRQRPQLGEDTEDSGKKEEVNNVNLQGGETEVTEDIKSFERTSTLDLFTTVKPKIKTGGTHIHSGFKRPNGTSALRSRNGSVTTQITPKENVKPVQKFLRRRVNKFRTDANKNNTAGILQSAATTIQPTDTTVRPRKFEFPKRLVRPSTLPTASPLQATTTEAFNVSLDIEDNHSEESLHDVDTELVESKESPTDSPEFEEDDVADLANVAVAAIQSLATVPPSTEVPTSASVPVRRLSTQRTTTTTTTSRPTVNIRRGSPRPFSKTRSTTPKSETPKRSSYVTKNKSGSYELPADYEDYYAEPVDIPLSGKVRIHSDGYIECLDIGNFPHPFSCKKFISCAKMENGHLLGWEYTCPRGLSFDPIGGICNWSAGLGCKE